jgi:hypothetical protein
MILIWPLLILAGYADAICDAWRDGLTPLKWVALRWPEWYEGTRGPVKWKNNGNPFESDFWHNAKLVRVYAYCFALGFALGGYWLLATPVFAFVTGKAFAISYHNF